MALKANKGAHPPPPLKLDLTPMIDCTFQLIIFFILITDMSSRELEVLTLPRAPISTEDKGDDPDRIIVNIVDMSNPEVAGMYNPTWPPIVIKGRQVRDLDEMRRILRPLADPLRFPDTSVPEIAPGKYPSKKPLLIRCDQHQVFGWVQAVMQYVSLTPKKPSEDANAHLASELVTSPLIYKIEIAAKRKENSEVNSGTGQ
jgi:hypothetical protein